ADLALEAAAADRADGSAVGGDEQPSALPPIGGPADPDDRGKRHRLAPGRALFDRAEDFLQLAHVPSSLPPLSGFDGGYSPGHDLGRGRAPGRAARPGWAEPVLHPAGREADTRRARVASSPGGPSGRARA